MDDIFLRVLPSFACYLSRSFWECQGNWKLVERDFKGMLEGFYEEQMHNVVSFDNLVVVFCLVEWLEDNELCEKL